nr:MAG TPA: hypothetical protein [Caudoviricetes sp.]
MWCFAQIAKVTHSRETEGSPPEGARSRLPARQGQRTRRRVRRVNGAPYPRPIATGTNPIRRIQIIHRTIRASMEQVRRLFQPLRCREASVHFRYPGSTQALNT